MIDEFIPRPMRACPESLTRENIKKLTFPVIVSDKEDGIRCRTYARNGVVTAFSRTHIPIPNIWIQDHAEKYWFPGLDGEVVLVNPIMQFNDIQSFCMSQVTLPQNFRLRVFDWTLDPKMPYLQRLQKLRNMIGAYNPNDVELIPTRQIHSPKDLCIWFNMRVKQGKEGLIVRSPSGPYKHGQATWNEGYMYKFKKWEDAEAEIIGFVEAQANRNQAKRDSYGLTKRSSHKANKVGKGMLGALKCKMIPEGIKFEIGSGWTHVQALWIWFNQTALLGKRVTYKYHNHGIKEKPRGAIYKSIRED